MGRGSLEAAKVLVEELQLPLTPEEVVKISQDKLLEQFPSALLMPGENIKFMIHIYLFFCYETIVTGINYCTHMWYIQSYNLQTLLIFFSKQGVMVKICWICITYNRGQVVLENAQKHEIYTMWYLQNKYQHPDSPFQCWKIAKYKLALDYLVNIAQGYWGVKCI